MPKKYLAAALLYPALALFSAAAQSLAVQNPDVEAVLVSD
jgi:hypothetical protein